MKKLLIVVDAPGPAEFIAPVIPLLAKKYKIRVVTVKDSPTKILAKYKPVRCDSESEAEPIYKKFKPDALLAAISSLTLGPYVNNEFTKLARADGKKIICFQDYWANHRWPMNFKMMRYWDAMLVLDEMAENFVLQDDYRGEVIVTGSPAFDKFGKIDVAKEKARLRKKFLIPASAFVILHCGTGTPQSWKEDEITFKFIAETIREIQTDSSTRQLINSKLILISRPHPRDENPNRYKNLAPDLNLLDTSSVGLTEELLPIADVVIAMYSTNLVHACYLRIPAISILLPDAGKKILDRVSLPDFPPNGVGATVGVYKESVNILKEKIMTDEKHRAVIKLAQERFFPLNKKPSAHKVADEVLRIFK